MTQAQLVVVDNERIVGTLAGQHCDSSPARYSISAANLLVALPMARWSAALRGLRALQGARWRYHAVRKCSPLVNPSEAKANSQARRAPSVWRTMFAVCLNCRPLRAGARFSAEILVREPDSLRPLMISAGSRRPESDARPVHDCISPGRPAECNCQLLGLAGGGRKKSRGSGGERGKLKVPAYSRHLPILTPTF